MNDRALSGRQKLRLYKSGWRKVTILSLCLGLSVLLAIAWSHRFRSVYGGTGRVDFGEIYYGARCAIHHLDPYNPELVLRTFRADGGTFPSKDAWASAIIITIDVNLPTTLFLAAPLALLPFGLAQGIWISLTIVLLVIAGYLVWTVGDNRGSVLCGCLIGVMLANCQQMFMVGNVAGIAVGLCVIATWCLLKNRHPELAVALFALSLAFKPHDVGFVWLYFLLAGGAMRRRALQILAVTCAIGVAASIWIAPASPYWLQELHHNHLIVGQVGSTSDPSLAGLTSGMVGAILDLQATLSLVISHSQTCNLASYLIVGPLIAAWAWMVMRRRMTSDSAWLALAAISVFSLLPIYHRPYDAKLLLLAVPACAKLWSEGGARRWLALGFTASGVLFTSDIFMGLLVAVFRKPALEPIPTHKVMAMSLFPPVVLLATGCFYLWVFMRDTAVKKAHLEINSAELLTVSSAG